MTLLCVLKQLENISKYQPWLSNATKKPVDLYITVYFKQILTSFTRILTIPFLREILEIQFDLLN